MPAWPNVAGSVVEGGVLLQAVEERTAPEEGTFRGWGAVRARRDFQPADEKRYHNGINHHRLLMIIN